MRAWRAKNKVKCILAWLRDRARRKGMECDLTVEWLTAFLQDYDPTLHHIDRISAAKGYTMDNLQILPISDNIAKGNRERWGQLQCL